MDAGCDLIGVESRAVVADTGEYAGVERTAQERGGLGELGVGGASLGEDLGRWGGRSHV